MSIDLDKIIQSMNLPKEITTFKELELLSDEIDEKIIETMVDKT